MAPAVDLRVSTDASATARAAATYLCGVARAAIAERGEFRVAFSGGSTPTLLFRVLAMQKLDWSRVQVWQVDERVAPDGDPVRNAVDLQTELLRPVHAAPGNIHLMDVTAADLDVAATRYAATLDGFDVVHLGLGDDGHTASWPPDQPAVLDVEALVTVTAPFRDHRRMTLTPRAVAVAREVLWLVCGADKQVALGRLLARDASQPAHRAFDARSVIFADRAATST